MRETVTILFFGSECVQEVVPFRADFGSKQAVRLLQHDCEVTQQSVQAIECRPDKDHAAELPS